MQRSLLERIVTDPKVMAGKPVIKGTRVPVDLIIHRIAQGETVEHLLEDYPKMTRQDVRAALEYASSVVRASQVAPARGRKRRSGGFSGGALTELSTELPVLSAVSGSPPLTLSTLSGES